MKIDFSAKEIKEDKMSDKGYDINYCYLLAIADKNPKLFQYLKLLIGSVDRDLKKDKK